LPTGFRAVATATTQIVLDCYGLLARPAGSAAEEAAPTDSAAFLKTAPLNNSHFPWNTIGGHRN
jgi:hypothetical protein